MKKIITIPMMILLIMTLVNAPSHPESIPEVDLDRITAGVTPNNIFYGLDIAIEKIQLALTFNETKKQILRLEFVDERLGEIKMMIKNNKPQFIERAEIERVEIIEDIEKNMNKTEISRKDFILSKLEKHILVLQEVKTTAPEQAQKGLDNAINQSSKVIEKIRTRGKP